MRCDIPDHRNAIFSYRIVLLQRNAAQTITTDLKSSVQFVFGSEASILFPAWAFCVFPSVYLLSSAGIRKALGCKYCKILSNTNRKHSVGLGLLLCETRQTGRWVPII